MSNVRPNTSFEALRHHYDIGNDFYRLWLDPSLTYSCALWDEKEGYDALEAAQLRKIDYHIAEAEARGANRVLDIGCGWGSVLNRLVEIHECKHAVGITLTEAHSKWVSSFNNPKIEVRLESWADHHPTESYDALISLGVFEHFARRDHSIEEKIAVYRSFFTSCHRWLKPGSMFALQTISYGNARREDMDPFISNEIFPESDLPCLPEIVTALERIFEVVKIRNDRKDYALTCRAWLKRLIKNRKKAVVLVGEDVVDRYQHYLQSSIFSFEVGSLALYRMTLRRIGHPRQ